MAKKISKYLYFIVCFAFLTYMTLYFSDFIVAKLNNGFALTNQFLSLNYVQNTGAAFSILTDAKELLIISSVVAICIICFYILKHELSMITLFFLAMLCAGISGNLHERIVFGFVRDYIQLEFVNFPVFNIADILINISVIVLIVMIIKKKI